MKIKSLLVLLTAILVINTQANIKIRSYVDNTTFPTMSVSISNMECTWGYFVMFQKEIDLTCESLEDLEDKIIDKLETKYSHFDVIRAIRNERNEARYETFMYELKDELLNSSIRTSSQIYFQAKKSLVLTFEGIIL